MSDAARTVVALEEINKTLREFVEFLRSARLETEGEMYARMLGKKPASEGGKVECENCHHSCGASIRFENGIQAEYHDCKPAQPELAKVECPNCRHPVGPGWDHEASPQRFTCKPAQPEPATCQHCEEPDHEGEPCYVTLMQPEPAKAKPKVEIDSLGHNYTRRAEPVAITLSFLLKKRWISTSCWFIT